MKNITLIVRIRINAAERSLLTDQSFMFDYTFLTAPQTGTQGLITLFSLNLGGDISPPQILVNNL